MTALFHATSTCTAPFKRVFKFKTCLAQDNVLTGHRLRKIILIAYHNRLTINGLCYISVRPAPPISLCSSENHQPSASLVQAAISFPSNIVVFAFKNARIYRFVNTHFLNTKSLLLPLNSSCLALELARHFNSLSLGNLIKLRTLYLSPLKHSETQLRPFGFPNGALSIQQLRLNTLVFRGFA